MHYSYLAYAPSTHEDVRIAVQEAYDFNGSLPDELCINEQDGSFLLSYVTVSVNTGFLHPEIITIPVTKDQYVPLGIMYLYRERIAPSNGMTVPDNAYKDYKSCDHEYTRYEGLMNRFDYCTKCDDKKEIV